MLLRASPSRFSDLASKFSWPCWKMLQPISGIMMACAPDTVPSACASRKQRGWLHCVKYEV
jgi:hypothetical protein